MASIFAATLLSWSPAWAATVLWYQTRNDAGVEQTFEVTPGSATFEAEHQGGRSVTITSIGAEFLRLEFAGPYAESLGPGPFEEAAWAPFKGTSPGISFIPCTRPMGRFVVLDLDLSTTDATVNRFAANFQIECEGSVNHVHGEIRYNSAVPISRDLPPGDSSPDPFALQAQMPVGAGALVESNAIVLYGVNAAVPLSITGGEYSLNGSPFTSQSGVGAQLGRIVVRARAPTAPGATAQAILTAGGVSAVFSVRAHDPTESLTGLYYRSTEGDFVGGGQTNLHLAPRNIVAASRNSRDGVSFELEGAAGVRWNLDLKAPNDAMLSPGSYEGAERFAFAPAGAAGLDFFGEGRGCNTIHGRFTVHEAVYAQDGAVEKFAADFEQRCEQATAPPLFGEVRFNSTVPFTALAPAPAQAGRMTNLSTRAQSLTGSDVLIGGFVIGGASNKTVMIRARGPSLVPYGIANALANPTLQLVRSSDQSLIAANDDWQSAGNAAAMEWSGYAPSNPAESGILVSLAPGAYTAIVSGVGGGTGVAIVEVFELAQPENRLMNISTRGQVLTGNDVMIGGFVVQGESPKTVVVRGRGPSLAAFGIPNALANPRVQLVRSSDQTEVAANDDWEDAANANEVLASGFAPSDPLESALRVTLQPGAYTVILSGVGATTGVGIVEVFDAQ